MRGWAALHPPTLIFRRREPERSWPDRTAGQRP